MIVLDMFLQLCINLWVILLNSLMAVKYFLLGVNYFQILVILVTMYSVYRLSVAEIEEVKDPYTKAGRRRI